MQLALRQPSARPGTFVMRAAGMQIRRGYARRPCVWTFLREARGAVVLPMFRSGWGFEGSLVLGDGVEVRFMVWGLGKSVDWWWLSCVEMSNLKRI